MPRYTFAPNSSVACFARQLLLATISLLFAVAAVHGQPAPKLPSQDELVALQRHTLLALNAAVREKSSASFYEQELSTVWRKRTTVKELTADFQPFINQKGFDLSAVAKAKAVYDKPPEVHENGVLLVQGHYLVSPDQIAFKLRYVHESDGWKLLSMNVDAKFVFAIDAKSPR